MQQKAARVQIKPFCSNNNGLARSGKTVDEVWNAIKANQAQLNYEQPFTVGHLLEGIGVGLPESPREPIQAAQLQLMQQFGQSQLDRRQPRVHQARLPDPPQLQIHSQGPPPPSFSPVQYAAQQRQLNDRPAALQQHPQPQQYPQQQYTPQQPQHAQQHFRQPAQQQSQHQAQEPAQQRRSPARSRGSGKGSPDKVEAADRIAVSVRANSQYPPAQQVAYALLAKTSMVVCVATEADRTHCAVPSAHITTFLQTFACLEAAKRQQACCCAM